MHRPLEDVLADRPDLAGADSRAEAEAHIKALFLEAQGKANAYSAERLQEIYEVAERALALAAAFPPALPELPKGGKAPLWRRLPDLAASYGGGLLLAACAPLVADTSVILAAGCGVAAVLSLAFPGRGTTKIKSPRRDAPKAVEAKFQSLITAADRTLSSMTAPRALEAPTGPRAAFPEEDVAGFLQDALMLSRMSAGSEGTELAKNAERLAERAGFHVAWEGDDELFEVMVDPDIDEPMLLKPALVHKTDSTKTVFGVMVRGRRS